MFTYTWHGMDKIVKSVFHISESHFTTINLVRFLRAQAVLAFNSSSTFISANRGYNKKIKRTCM